MRQTLTELLAMGATTAAVVESLRLCEEENERLREQNANLIAQMLIDTHRKDVSISKTHIIVPYFDSRSSPSIGLIVPIGAGTWHAKRRETIVCAALERFPDVRSVLWKHRVVRFTVEQFDDGETQSIKFDDDGDFQ